MNRNSLLLLAVGMAAGLYWGCTNFDWRQDVTRFDQSTDGSLPQPANLDAPGTNDFAFAAFGDSHYGMSDGVPSIIQDGLTTIEADPEIDFVFGLGDLVNTGRRHQYDGLNALRAQFSTKPFYAVIGNHDVFFNGWTYFKQHYGRAVYTFQVDHVTFIVLDSASAGMHRGQFRWFEERLQEHVNDVVIVTMHVPVYTGLQGHYLLWDDPEQGYRFLSLAKKYNVDLVLQAHWHKFDETNVGGVRYIVTGSWNTDLDGAQPHYVKVSVSGTTITAIPVYL